MATNVSNATTVLSGLYNGTIPTVLRDRVVAAYAKLLPVGATNDQIAALFLADIMRHVKDQVKFAESLAATTSTAAAVDTDFTPLP